MRILEKCKGVTQDAYGERSRHPWLRAVKGASPSLGGSFSRCPCSWNSVFHIGFRAPSCIYRIIYNNIYIHIYTYIYIINSFRLRYMYVPIYIYIPPYLNIYRKLLPMHMYTPNVYIHVYHNICTVYPRAFHNIEFWQPVLLFEKLSKMLGNEQTARPGVWYKHILRVWIKPSKTRGLLNCCMEKYGKYANTNPLFKEPCSVFSELASLTLSVFVGSFGTYMPWHC